MHVQRIGDAPLNRRGNGQDSYLLLTRGQFGSQHLSITWVNCAPRSEQRLHEHPEQEQVYVIITGTGVMKVAGEEADVSAGDCVFVPPGNAHAIRNTGTESLSYVSATSPPFDLEALEADQRYSER